MKTEVSDDEDVVIQSRINPKTTFNESYDVPRQFNKSSPSDGKA